MMYEMKQKQQITNTILLVVGFLILIAVAIATIIRLVR